MGTLITSPTGWIATPSTTDGTVVVPLATSKLALYGGPNSPIAQQVIPTAVATTAATSTTPYGFGSAAQANAVVAAVNDIIAKLALINTWA